MEDFHDWVTGELPVSVNEIKGGYSFYPRGKGRRYLFTTVKTGPRVYVDPSAKETVHGATPQVIRKNPNFEGPGTWEDSFNYSYMIDQDEIPEDLKEAVLGSYELVDQRRW